MKPLKTMTAALPMVCLAFISLVGLSLSAIAENSGITKLGTVSLSNKISPSPIVIFQQEGKLYSPAPSLRAAEPKCINPPIGTWFEFERTIEFIPYFKPNEDTLTTGGSVTVVLPGERSTRDTIVCDSGLGRGEESFFRITLKVYRITTVYTKGENACKESDDEASVLFGRLRPKVKYEEVTDLSREKEYEGDAFLFDSNAGVNQGTLFIFTDESEEDNLFYSSFQQSLTRKSGAVVPYNYSLPLLGGKVEKKEGQRVSEAAANALILSDKQRTTEFVGYSIDSESQITMVAANGEQLTFALE